MRTRPQPNPRRGILRAAGAAVILLILLLIAVAITSSATAPTVQAPTAPVVPNTPKPLRRSTPLPTRTTRTTPVPTVKKGALGSTTGLMSAVYRDDSGQQLFAHTRTASRPVVGSAVPGRPLAFFTGGDDPYGRTLLYVRLAPKAKPILVGAGDPLVRPIWSPDNRYLLYARVRATPTTPGVTWFLIVFDTVSGGKRVLATMPALNLTPLGWSHGRVVYLVANGSDTSLFAVAHGQTKYLGVVVSEPIVSATLSPDGRRLAFGTPTNCAYCTVNVFDIEAGTLWSGPTGMPNETTLAWSARGRTLFASMGDRLDTIDVESDTIRQFPLPPGLPTRWQHEFVGSEWDASIALVDAVTGQQFRSHA